jgi:hypothetical protein
MNFSYKKEIDFCFRILKNFKLNFFINQEQKTLKNYSFSTVNADPPDQNNSYNFAEVGINIKMGFYENFIHTPSGRVISFGSDYPMIWLNIHRGITHLNGNFDYTKYEIKITKTFTSSRIGKSRIQITAGKTTGTIPLCNLYNSPGSYEQLGIEAENSFATMRTNEFFSDEFASLFLKQDFGSLFFSRPSFKPEINIITNIGFGRLLHPEYHHPVNFKTLEKGYYESGILIHKLLSTNFVGYGLGIFYRYGPYSFSSPAKNIAYKITVKLNL